MMNYYLLLRISWIKNKIPAATRYEKAAAQIDAMQADIDAMKSVMREHRDKLRKFS